MPKVAESRVVLRIALANQGGLRHEIWSWTRKSQLVRHR